MWVVGWVWVWVYMCMHASVYDWKRCREVGIPTLFDCFGGSILTCACFSSFGLIRASPFLFHRTR